MEIAELSSLIHLHGKALYGLCYQLTRNKEETEDLYQETFLKAAELCHKIDLQKNPKAFLASIAIGLWKNHYKKYSRRQQIAPVETLEEAHLSTYPDTQALTVEELLISQELKLTIQGAVDQLSDKLRLPLYMYYTAEMSIEEIAKALKIPQGTVKSRLHKARTSLKKILEVNDDGKF